MNRELEFSVETVREANLNECTNGHKYVNNGHEGPSVFNGGRYVLFLFCEKCGKSIRRSVKKDDE